MADPQERKPAEQEPSVEVTEKIELLIAPRRSLMAKKAGIQPLSAASMNSAISSVQRLEGAEILREIRPGRKLKTLSMADEATSIFKVRMNIDAAVALFQTAPPNVAVEVDSFLSYGQAGMLPTLGAILAQRLGSLGRNMAQQVRLRIVGPDGEAVVGAQVILEGAGFPQEGETNKNGEVVLAVFGQTGSPLVRSLLVRPAKDYWNRYLSSPSLSTTTNNIIKLHALREVIPGFPNNAEFGWGQKYMGLDQLPDEYTGKGVKIAIIDSGADTKHPILKHIQNGIDLTNNRDTITWANDVVGHGSHCAGIITGQSKSAQAIRGFAPEAEIHVLKVFPGGQFSSLVDALRHCIENGIDVVNMSLGSADSSDSVEQELDDALQNGVACIVAAGNSGGQVQYPARSGNVMAVAAIGMLSEFPRDSWESQTVVPGLVTGEGVFSPSFTCFGPEIAVAAPGVGIVSSVPGTGFDAQSGTSMAAPHITGLAALLLAHHPLFKTSLRERNAQRVAGLFQLLRSLASPLPLDQRRIGAGAPRLFNVVSAFESAKEQPTAGAAPGGTLPFSTAPQLAPQALFGSSVGSLIGREIDKALGGSGQIGSAIGNTAGGFLPFSAAPQLAQQGLLGGSLGSRIGREIDQALGGSGLFIDPRLRFWG